MQFPNKRQTAVVFTVVMLLASVMMMANVSNVSVQAAEVGVSGPIPAGKTPNFTAPTVASLSVRPPLLGVGQSVLVNAWITPSGQTGRVFPDYKFTFTKPDGTTQSFTIDSEPATAAIWFEWPADMVGIWKLDFHFPGAYYNGTTNEAVQSVYYEPCDAKQQTFTVQADMVASWPPSPLPTDYWTRPVEFHNREWWPILGNYPAAGYDGTIDSSWDTLFPNTNPYGGPQGGYDFTPWVLAPNSSHVVWKKLDAQGGIVGGQTGARTGQTGSAGLPTIIYAGRAYQTVTKPMQVLVNGTYIWQPTSVWECYDIRTGQVYWDLTGIANPPTLIEYTYSGETVQGSAGSASATLMYLSSTRMIKYNPWTGAVTANISIPSMAITYYKNKYVLTVQDLGAAAANATGGRYRLINWTTTGTSATFSSRVISNVSYARSSLPSLIDYNTAYGATVVRTDINGVMNYFVVTSYNWLTGMQLWNKSFTGYTLYSGSCIGTDHGKLTFKCSRINDQFGRYLCYDLATGEELWESDVMDYPWDSSGFGGYMFSSAYGMFYVTTYSGIYAFSWDTGKIIWHYTSTSYAPFESPYIDVNGTEVYSDNTGLEIADGKVYSYNCEHTQTWPRTRGWSTFCVDAFTGKEIWRIKTAGITAFGDSIDIGPVADGYICELTGDGYMFVYGKGKSATAVTATDTTVPLGTAVLIRGTVLDQSPAQPGTPCVSKDSMSTQMEYLHLQYQIGGLWGNETITGVPVSLTALGSDGTYYDLGTATSDGYTGAFSKSWVAPKEGVYAITASFLGDESYGSSMAGTGVSVGPAPAPIDFPPETEPTDYSAVLYGILAAVIVAIVVGLIAVFLALRKR